MKGTLEFTLPEEEEEFRAAQDGGAWKSLVWDLNEELRKWQKYGKDNKQLKALEDMIVSNIRDLILTMLDETELNLG